MAGPPAARDRSPLLHYGSGTADEDEYELPTRSRQFTIPDKRGELPRLPLRTVFYALNGGALFVLLSLCVSMHNTISRMETQTGSSVYVQFCRVVALLGALADRYCWENFFFACKNNYFRVCLKTTWIDMEMMVNS
ncbi:hypothetical protein PR001_g30829 [Phytophthora rubi]|uniref:Uncharacterized protein n=1 Tax=Phytophthora rubi TaxID=129364 RepID=A0A6A3GL18_9STRA|nr:hypothetical protein PR001_g30829 [Phytophthora rubi]